MKKPEFDNSGDPVERGIDFDPGTSFGGYQVGMTQNALQGVKQGLLDVDRMKNEGIQSANDAAEAMFAQNATGFSKALSSRARKAMTLGRSNNQVQGSIDNTLRQRARLQNSMSHLAQMHSLRKQNLMGQIKFADELANYQDAMEAAKLSVLGTVISGAGTAAGFALGGPVGGALAGSLTMGGPAAKGTNNLA